MKNIFSKIYFALLLASVPALVLAAPLDGVKGLLTGFGGILKDLIPVLFGLCLVYFFWGLVQFIGSAGDAKLREEGKNKILWGIIALFVFVSVYGLIRFIGQLVNIDVDTANSIPVNNLNVKQN